MRGCTKFTCQSHQYSCEHKNTSVVMVGGSAEKRRMCSL